jgi:hypothetical protein
MEALVVAFDSVTVHKKIDRNLPDHPSPLHRQVKTTNF